MLNKEKYDKNILLIDNGKQRHNLSSRLRMTGHRVELVTSGFHGIHMLEEDHFDVVIIKNHPEDMPSFEVTGLIRTKWDENQMKVIFMQDRDFVDTKQMHHDMGVTEVVLSDINFGELLKKIEGKPAK